MKLHFREGDIPPPSSWMWRVALLAAALAMLPAFFERDPVAHPIKETAVSGGNAYIDSRINALPDNECRQPLPFDGSPMECKWVFVDENGVKWWVYSRHY
jgi:hypothetical protein